MTQSIAGFTRTLGEPGDLADIIVVTMSIARLDHGLMKLSRSDFYDVFRRLTREFPKKFPPMVFTQSGEYVYSKTLGDALERAVRLGIEVMNPRFCYFGIKDESDAKSNLKLVQDNAGKKFIQDMHPIAKRLAVLAGASVHERHTA
jgi:hypothetical protein